MNHVKKYAIVFLLGIIGFFAFFILSKTFIQRKKPICKNCNVILITLDTLGSNHLPCYGYERNTAPNLCKFAKDNVFFTRSYSHNPITIASTFSLLTSQYPSSHKMLFELAKQKLNTSFITLPEIMQMNEYKTFYFGTVDLNQIPFNRGIERGFDVIHKQSDDPSQWKRIYEIFLNQKETDKPIFTFIYSGFLHSPYLVKNAKSLRFTDEYYSYIPTSLKDFFLFDEDFFQFVLSSLEERIQKSYTIESRKWNTDLYSILKNSSSLQEAKEVFFSFPGIEIQSNFSKYHTSKINLQDKKQLEYFKALYLEKLYELDNKLIKFINFINSKKIKKNTIVIITSQHGEAFGEHGAYIHGGDMYKEQIMVPIIMAIPGLKHVKRNDIFQGIDVYPTLSSLLGIKPVSKLQGKDLSNLLYGIQNNERNEYAIAEYGGFHFRLIQNKNWSFYIRKKGNISELYNLQTDPGEYENVLLQYPHIAGRMFDALNNAFPSQYEEKKEYNFPLWVDEIKKEKIIREGYF